MTDARDAYQQHSVTTAEPAQRVVQLYDIAVVAIQRAQAADKRDADRKVETINNQLIRAQQAIGELELSLDPTPNPELVDRLAAIYQYCRTQLIDANVSKDLSGMDAVVGLLSDLRDAWEQAAKAVR